MEHSDAYKDVESKIARDTGPARRWIAGMPISCSQAGLDSSWWKCRLAASRLGLLGHVRREQIVLER